MSIPVTPTVNSPATPSAQTPAASSPATPPTAPSQPPAVVYVAESPDEHGVLPSDTPGVRERIQKASARAAAAEKRAQEAEAKWQATQTELGEVRGKTRRLEARVEVGIDDDGDLGSFLAAYDKAHSETKPEKRPSLKAWRDGLASDEKAAAESGLPASFRKTYLVPPNPNATNQVPAVARTPVVSNGVVQAKTIGSDPSKWTAEESKAAMEMARNTDPRVARLFGQGRGMPGR